MSSDSSNSIPFIITKCISEIERRALKMKVREQGMKERSLAGLLLEMSIMVGCMNALFSFSLSFNIFSLFPFISITLCRVSTE